MSNGNGKNGNGGQAPPAITPTVVAAIVAFLTPLLSPILVPKFLSQDQFNSMLVGLATAVVIVVGWLIHNRVYTVTNTQTNELKKTTDVQTAILTGKKTTEIEALGKTIENQLPHSH